MVFRCPLCCKDGAGGFQVCLSPTLRSTRPPGWLGQWGRPAPHGALLSGSWWRGPERASQLSKATERDRRQLGPTPSDLHHSSLLRTGTEINRTEDAPEAGAGKWRGRPRVLPAWSLPQTQTPPRRKAWAWDLLTLVSVQAGEDWPLHLWGAPLALGWPPCPRWCSHGGRYPQVTTPRTADRFQVQGQPRGTGGQSASLVSGRPPATLQPRLCSPRWSPPPPPNLRSPGTRGSYL